MSYKVPDERYFRIHHIRPRFKDDVENVLVFMASEIAQIPELPAEEFKEAVNSAVRKYPGNISKSWKTVNNWRTEISSLFGLLEYSEDGSRTKPGKMALLLSEKQDLVEFFRYFLYYFQYPGGHLKSYQIRDYILSGIKFKPVSYILKVLIAASEINGRDFGINKAEATHCLFNDLGISRDKEDPRLIAKLLIDNRNNETQYNWGGDVTRYAGDILDYMVLADLLDYRPNSYYYVNNTIPELIESFTRGVWFDGYDRFYGIGDPKISEIEKERPRWFSYVNRELDERLFETDIASFLKASEQFRYPDIRRLVEDFQIKVESGMIRIDEIKEFGEALCHKHEVEKFKSQGRRDLLHLIVRMPTKLAVGYDIKSLEDDERHKFIEVKTTISRSRIRINRFHLTTNEWRAAETLDGSYYVYRFLISKDILELFVINDPVKKYKKGLITMIPRDGADITYHDNAGKKEKLRI